MTPYRIWGKEPDEKVDPNAFMHTFTFQKRDEDDKPLSDEEELALAEEFKKTIMKAVGYRPDGKKQMTPDDVRKRNRALAAQKADQESKELYRGRVIHNKAIKPTVNKKDDNGR